MSGPTHPFDRATVGWRAGIFFAGLPMLALTSFGLALALGSTPVHPFALLQALTEPEASPLLHAIVWELRLPRALSAFAVGGLLALAGTLVQVMVQNPLGDPYVLGVSGGASTAALSAMLLGAPAAWLAPSAFAGALVATFLVLLIGGGSGPRTATGLLLCGVALAAGWSALIGFILTISPQAQVPGMLFWLMGDLGQPGAPGPALAVLGLASLAALGVARPLNLLGRGELQAAALGVEVRPLYAALLVLSSLLTATAVANAGSIGFVGLVAPHLVRLMVGANHRRVVPGAVLLGGTLLLVADTLARTAFAPQQLPVGIITALLGVPFFLYLLHRRGMAAKAVA